MSDPFIVTTRDLYERIVEIEERLGGALAADERLRDQLTELCAYAADHETRLRSIERWRYALPLVTLTALVTGVAAVVSAINGA